jgi:hypothetical protein
MRCPNKKNSPKIKRKNAQKIKSSCKLNSSSLKMCLDWAYRVKYRLEINGKFLCDWLTL